MNTIEFIYYSDLNGLPIKIDCTYTPFFRDADERVDGDFVTITTVEVNRGEDVCNIITFINDDHLDELTSLAHIYFKENFELTVTAKMKA